MFHSQSTRPAVALDHADSGSEQHATERATDQELPAQPSAHHRGPRGFLTSRGAFVMILIVTSAACVIGFVVTSAAVIPAIAGWSLALSSLLAAAFIRERDKLMAVWNPPLVMALVVGVLGQVTLLGTAPTLARELSMFLAAMASAAPAQVIAVLGSFLIVRWRFPKKWKHQNTDTTDNQSA